MKADFEKGTKVCSRCKKELPIEMFSKNKNIKIINKKEETLFSQLKVGDCFILKQAADSALYMKTAEVRFKNAMICNSVNLNNGRYILLGSIDEITKVSVDITAKVQ